MSKKPHNVTIVTKYTKTNREEAKRYTRVGVAFFNTNDAGDTIVNITLDFPVGAQELVLFPPKEDDAG